VDAAPAGDPAGQTRSRRSVRRTLGLTASAAAAFVTVSCAAGQHAQTAYERPTPQDFAFAQVGSLSLRVVAIQAPDRVSGSATNYPAGAAVPLTMAVVNQSGSKDTLRNITSPAFTGWGVYPTGSVVAAASSATSSSPSASSASLPSSSSSLAPSPSSTSPSLGAPSARSVTIPPGESVRLGIVNQTGSDTRTGADVSAQTVVLTGLHGKTYAPLYPSVTVPVTFTFARNGSVTLKVPVQLTAPSPGVTIPTLATIANGG
jgi:copper(I)-binding protein